LIVKPSFIFSPSKDQIDPQYFFYVLLGAMLKATDDLITKYLGKSVHFQAINLVMSCSSVILYTVLCLYQNIPLPNLSYIDLSFLTFRGIAIWGCITCGVLALQNEKASRVSAINYLSVPLVYIVDILFFHKSLLAIDIVGIILIISCNFGVGLYKSLERIQILEREFKRVKLERSY
jgi:uncharacterized membrane protein